MNKNQIALEFTLENEDWLSSAELKKSLGWSYSKIKRIAKSMNGEVARINKDYKLTRNLSKQDIEEINSFFCGEIEIFQTELNNIKLKIKNE